MAAPASGEVIYHLDEEETPYFVKIPVPADRITLRDFRGVLHRPNCKYFFKSMDQDFGSTLTLCDKKTSDLRWLRKFETWIP